MNATSAPPISISDEQHRLLTELRELASTQMPCPGGGDTAARHHALMAIGRRDLSLARLAEAHFDAVAILLEAGRTPGPGALYGVWASERRGHELSLVRRGHGWSLSGRKHFCSGAGLVDRALVTAGVGPPQLIDVDLRDGASAPQIDLTEWQTPAFASTNTGTVTFAEVSLRDDDRIATPGWYLQRPGFWHGACGPAACWAGGAEGLLDYARRQTSQDAHQSAHLGAMYAAVWSLKASLEQSGNEIDRQPGDTLAARIRARILRHLVEQSATEILQRLPRAFGPRPLAFDPTISRRYYELDLYLRQSHAERDLEALGRDVLAAGYGEMEDR